MSILILDKNEPILNFVVVAYGIRLSGTCTGRNMYNNLPPLKVMGYPNMQFERALTPGCKKKRPKGVTRSN